MVTVRSKILTTGAAAVRTALARDERNITDSTLCRASWQSVQTKVLCGQGTLHMVV